VAGKNVSAGCEILISLILAPEMLDNSTKLTVSLTTTNNEFAVSALTSLAGRQKEHPAFKKLSDKVLVCLSDWSEMQMMCMRSS